MLHATTPAAPHRATSAVSEEGAESGFAARLRETTKAVHREAERSGFVADLIRGRATREGYGVYLRNLVPAYASLEAALAASEHAPSRLMAAFSDPALRRLPHLLADLAAVAGPAWAQICPVLPEAQHYARSIETADGAPQAQARLAAHAYARYLGDLSGGQILKPLLARSLGLGADALTFYAFPAFDDVETAKRRIRAALDTVPTNGAMADVFIAEAIAAFRHNIALSTAVSDTLRVAAG